MKKNRKIIVKGRSFPNPKKRRSIRPKEPKQSEREAAQIAKSIWQRFRTSCFESQCTEEQIAGRILALRDTLTLRVKHKGVLTEILDTVDLTYRKCVANFKRPEPPEEGEPG